MYTAGIIAEYNPFHNGHLHHIEQARRLTDADYIVAIMSGDFVQRGRPAAFEKWLRAEMAVKAGADVVIELPYIFSCNSSHEFARGAVEILSRLGVVDYLVSGSETADTERIMRTAEAISDREGKLSARADEIKKGGMSYAASRTEAIAEIYGSEYSEILQNPNDLLSVEYASAIIKSGSDIKPVHVKRVGAAHLEEGVGIPENPADSEIASGSAIRRLVAENDIFAIAPYVPATTMDAIKKSNAKWQSPSYDLFFHFLQYKILTSQASHLASIYSVAEGLENRMKNSLCHCHSYDDYAEMVKSKRYTRARIDRMLVHVLTDLSYEEFDDIKDTYYARILGISKKGTELLKTMRKSASIPLLSNISGLEKADPRVKAGVERDIKSAAIYSMICGKSSCHFDAEKKRIPYIEP